MKSLIRQGFTLFAVGGVVVSTLLASGLRALALTDEQIAERLRNVPVFTITDSDGSPLVSTPEAGEGPPVAGIFINPADAQAFLDDLRQENPELASSVNVVPVSLAEVYQLALAGQASEQRLEFAFIPNQDDVENAITIQQQETGEDVTSFEGVPLFIARSSTDGETGYLTIQQGNEQVIPMFFDKNDLQAMIQQLEQVQPDLAPTVSVQVINLEGLITTLENSDNPELERILLIPSEDALESIRNQSGPVQN
jgi:hypothetical protein